MWGRVHTLERVEGISLGLFQDMLAGWLFQRLALHQFAVLLLGVLAHL